jgi:hypothetical protein
MTPIADILKKHKKPRTLVEVDFGGMIKRWSTGNISVEHPGRNMPPPSILALHYNFENDAGDVLDVSGGGHSLNDTFSNVHGLVGRGYNLDDGYLKDSVISARLANIANSQGAVSLWLKHDEGAGTDWSDYFSLATDTSPYVHRIEVGYQSTATVGKCSVWAGFAKTTSPFYFRHVSVVDCFDVGRWVHLLWQWDHSSPLNELYVNGVLVGTSTTAGTPINVSAGNDIQISSGAGNYHGVIDEIRIYDRRLSAAEIRSLYRSPAGVKGNDRFFNGRLSQELQISTSFNLNSMSFGLQNVLAKIYNKDRFQDLEVDGPLDGGVGVVRMWCEGLDWEDIQEAGVLFKGLFFKDYHDFDIYSFKLLEYPLVRSEVIPPSTINADTWPDHSTGSISGSVSGLSQQFVFGDWTRGIPVRCVDITEYKYLAMAGVSDSADSDYVAETVNLYDADGVVIDDSEYVYYPGVLDGQGNVVSLFDMDTQNYVPLSCSIKGIVDNSGEITGTAGTLIEHPADICHYLLLNHTQFDAGDVSIGSLKTMKSLLPGLCFATFVNSPAETTDIIDRILGQCLYSSTQQNGKYTVIGLHPDAPVVETSKRWAQIGRTVRSYRTPNQNVCNQLQVLYAYNPTSGKWEGDNIFNRTNNERCSRSFYQYGLRPMVTLKLIDVQNEVVTQYLADRYLQLFSFRHDVVERTMPTWEAWGIEDGDAVRMDVLEGASRDGNGWVDEKFILLDHTIKGNTVKHKWWRVNV